MQVIVNGEQPFKATSKAFMINSTSAGYTLAYGVKKDGTFTNYSSSTPAGEVCIVNDAIQYAWYKLVGNSDNNVIVIM